MASQSDAATIDWVLILVACGLILFGIITAFV